MAKNENATSHRPQMVPDDRRTAGRPATHEGHDSDPEEPARYGPQLSAKAGFGATGQAPISIARAEWQGNDLVLRYPEFPQAEAYTREDFVEATEQTHAWRSAWLRAIGLAWSDEALNQQLLEDPYKFLLTHCEYRLPKTIDVVVVPDENSEWVKGMADRHNWRWNLTRNVLILHLPNKPEDVGQEAVALAAYEAAGKCYPFTAAC